MHNNEENEIIDFESLFRKEETKKEPKYPNMPLPKGVLMVITYFLIMGVVSSIFLLLFYDYENLVHQYTREEAMLYKVDSNPYSIGYLPKADFEELIHLYPDIEIMYQDDDFVFFGHSANPYLKANYTIEMLQVYFEDENATWNTDRPTVPVELYTIKWDGPFIVKYGFENREDALVRHPQSFVLITEAASALLNFVVYIFLAFTILPFGWKFLKDEIIYFNKPIKHLGVDAAMGYVYMILASLAAQVLVMVIGYLFDYAAPVSLNQQAIERALFSSNGILIVLMTVVFAPVLEELIFRKAFFGFFRNQTVALVISSVVFGFIHVSQETEVLAIVTNLITYSASGFALGYVYIKNKNNVWSSIFVHAVANAVSVMLILFQALL
ncbi:CPBP family intramembrane metalloprotease [Acholeplasma vituli]|uniref:CPBP family intramembrane metalloprotease n=1 Tax=Paracholeplasma vituli TaxID=69473 RepID=A0ABT2PWS6_9MOLU|nr:type II CAAX endopeptidase family protein [Paracholeplasma vituli]MCU0105418.1 CPBP family intramembrane metalloprotease [Paracholeplasma vituli]